MQQHLISTVSLLVAASSAILAIIFFAVYLILRVKNGTKEQPREKSGAEAACRHRWICWPHPNSLYLSRRSR